MRGCTTRARAQLLQQERFDDYRREFWYDHPDAPRDFVEYAVAGLGGPIYYFWSMLRVVMRTARLVAVHNPRVAADLREEFPGARDRGDPSRHGVDRDGDDRRRRCGAARVRQALGVPDDAVLFAAFGKITAEKRIGAILRAFDARRARTWRRSSAAGRRRRGYPALARELAASHAHRARPRHRLRRRTRRSAITCSRRTRACACAGRRRSKHRRRGCSAWRRPADRDQRPRAPGRRPVDRPAERRASHASAEPVAIAIDLIDEEEALLAAMRALATEPALRDAWPAPGTRTGRRITRSTSWPTTTRRLIATAAARPAPVVSRSARAFHRRPLSDRARDHGALRDRARSVLVLSSGSAVLRF